MAIDYDPYSDAAMADPFALYKEMRAEGCPHRIENRNAWALTRFSDVWKTSLNESLLDFTVGQTPGQLLLGEPCPKTFMTMNAPAHGRWRGVVAPFYSAEATEADEPRMRMLVREILVPLAAAGTFDVYRDFANRVMCRNAGHALGMAAAQSEAFRALIDEMMHREPGQVGASSTRNQVGAGQLFGHLSDFVSDLRRNPGKAVRQTKALMEASIDGQSLSDQEIVFYLFSILVTGSETTPLAVASTIYLLARHPDQKAAVIADPTLIPAAFRETLRLFQPTNMLARRARADFELGGRTIRAGDNLLLIYASANRDETRFADPDRFNIFRDGPRDLSFGIGAHVCLGASLAPVAAKIMIEELLAMTGDYELNEDGCARSYGEFLLGFTRVPIHFRPRPTGPIATFGETGTCTSLD
jgi:cytochrome P450